MKALTLTQPWASFVAFGEKAIETRSWWTPYRGPLAIHAAKGYPDWAVKMCWSNTFFAQLLAYHGISFPERLPRGVIVATCHVTGCFPTKRADALHLSVGERELGDFSPGRWMWMLAHVIPMEPPVPARGHLFLWEWEPPTNTEDGP